MATRPLQISIAVPWQRLGARLEARLEAERDRIALWLPVAFGGGIILWFALPNVRFWQGALLLLGAVAVGTALAGPGRRAVMMVQRGALAAACGVALVWLQAALTDNRVIARPVMTSFTATIERVEPQPARAISRVTVAPLARADLPSRLRLTLADHDHPSSTLTPGQAIALRARLMPPPGPALPGGYDFAQRAWFDGIGGVGSIIGVPVVAPQEQAIVPGIRQRLTRHIQEQLPGSAGGIAAALVTGDRGGIGDADNEAMQRSGLAHLLSVSGLHLTAVVGGTILLLMRLLALHQRLALRSSVPLLAAAGGALAGIGYTLLSGAEVPTIRACIAALLVLVALAMGREALTLRLVAAGALLVLALWPEAVVGPSFQMSFMAVTVIVALYEHPWVHAKLARRDEHAVRAIARLVSGLVLTGVAIELALTPIALFHFHKAGLYGALANVLAIPLTTFVIMPLEALALLCDSIGLGAPLWWLTGRALGLLVALAHAASSAPGAVVVLPRPGALAFGLAIGGLLWLLLWQTRWRWWGGLPAATGLALMTVGPTPDLLVTGDGRHVAVRLADGSFATLRARAGEFVRDQLGEAAGDDGIMPPLAAVRDSECNADMCRWTMQRSGRNWKILATRSRYLVDIPELAAACAAADIVIADRWLPPNCAARWLTLDRDNFDRHGGVAIYLDQGKLTTSIDPADAHPWRRPQYVSGNDEADPQGAPAP